MKKYARIWAYFLFCLGSIPRSLLRIEKHEVLQARSAPSSYSAFALDRKSYTHH